MSKVSRTVPFLAALVLVCAGGEIEDEGRIYDSTAHGFAFRVPPGWQVREPEAGEELVLSRPLPDGAVAAVTFSVHQSNAAKHLKKSLDDLVPALIHLKIDFRLSGRSSIESTAGGLEAGRLEYTCAEDDTPTVERIYLLALDEARALHLLATVPAVHAGTVLREFDAVVDSLRR